MKQSLRPSEQSGDGFSHGRAMEFSFFSYGSELRPSAICGWRFGNSCLTSISTCLKSVKRTGVENYICIYLSH